MTVNLLEFALVSLVVLVGKVYISLVKVSVEKKIKEARRQGLTCFSPSDKAFHSGAINFPLLAMAMFLKSPLACLSIWKKMYALRRPLTRRSSWSSR